MHADTVYLHLLAIQDKSFLCIETESTDAGGGTVTVEYLTGLFILEDAFYLIYIRCINTQRLGFFNSISCSISAGATGIS